MQNMEVLSDDLIPAAFWSIDKQTQIPITYELPKWALRIGCSTHRINDPNNDSVRYVFVMSKTIQYVLVELKDADILRISHETVPFVDKPSILEPGGNHINPPNVSKPA